jgi:hypothetical protein
MAKFKMMKVFSRQDMDAGLKKDLKTAREYMNDGNGLISWHIEHGEGYCADSNRICAWLLANGAEEDEHVVIDVSW